MRLVATLLLAIPCLAAGPQPPCGPDVLPAYAALDTPPAVQVWEKGDWPPPSCTGWTASGYTTLVAVAGRLRASAPLARIGVITSLKGIQYWSTTHQRWQTLVIDARPDIALADLTSGRRFTFEQEDSLSGKGTYELRILEATPDRIVYSTRNLTTLRYLLVPVFHPGDIESIYFLDREAKDTWRYYNLARIGDKASSLAGGHAPSAINRAIAYFRHLAGIPTNQDPPAAR